MNDNYKFNVTTDLLIFSVDSRYDNNPRTLPKKYISILLVKRDKDPFNNKWCLPGGFMKENETSNESAARILKKETDLENVYMQQIHVNDTIDRDPRGRIISISYLSLIDKSKLKSAIKESAAWFDIELTENNDSIKVKLVNNEELYEYTVTEKIKDIKTKEKEYFVSENDIAFDHAKLIIEGLMELRNKVNTTDIVFNLMPELFTIGELKQVYELLLGKKLINSAFRRTMADKYEMTDKVVKTGGHRPSNLYKYKEK